jgi:hypothetical protein
MELANIEKLVEKYLNAETSLPEEATLKNYFLEGDVAPHLQEYTAMFTYFVTSKDETYTKTIELEPKKSKKINLKWMSVAVSVVLLFSVFVANEQYKKHQVEKQFAQVSEALKRLSRNLQKGEEAVTNLYVYEDTIKNILK